MLLVATHYIYNIYVVVVEQKCNFPPKVRALGLFLFNKNVFSINYIIT